MIIYLNYYKNNFEKPERLRVATTQLSRSLETELSRSRKQATCKEGRKCATFPRHSSTPFLYFPFLYLLPSSFEDEQLLGQ
jgi:hypothetical protein